MRVSVFENSAPLLTFRFKKKVPGGGTVPYALDGGPTIEMYVKDSPDTLDSSTQGVVKYDITGGDITITDTGVDGTDKYSEITIQTAAADHAAPAVKYFHIDCAKGLGKETIADGFYEIKNI